MLDWMKYKLESRTPGDINILRYADDTTLMAKSGEELKSLLMKLKETCVPPMFIATLFKIARTSKQHRCPSADEWIRKLWYIYTMEYYRAIKT